ncbi:hypothetical protein QQM79_08410 [Marinobacteraceae bacterium S3BR75-40.1]
MLFGPQHSMESLLQKGWERRPRRLELMSMMVRSTPPLTVTVIFVLLISLLLQEPFTFLGSASMILKFLIFVGGIWAGMQLGFTLQRLMVLLLNRRMLRQNGDLREAVRALRGKGLSERDEREIMRRHPFGI